jgi:hypothetical protein
MSTKFIVQDNKRSTASLSEKLLCLPVKDADSAIVSIRIPSKSALFLILAVIGVLFKHFNGHPRVLYSRLCEESMAIEITFYSSLSELLEETQI